MDSSKIQQEHYTKYLHEFIDDLSKGFPENEAVQKVVLVKEKINAEKHVLYFQKQLEDKTVSELFISKNEKLFMNDKRYFIPTIDFTELWKTATDESKETIWKYLHTLYIFGQQLSSESLNMDILEQLVKNTQLPTENKDFNIDDLLGSGNNELAGQMNELVKNFANSFGENGKSPLETLKDPTKLKGLFSQVESQVKNMCNDKKFDEKDLQDYAESMKNNLENKLNIPLDSIMSNMQNLMGNPSGDKKTGLPDLSNLPIASIMKMMNGNKS